MLLQEEQFPFSWANSTRCKSFFFFFYYYLGPFHSHTTPQSVLNSLHLSFPFFFAYGQHFYIFFPPSRLSPQREQILLCVCFHCPVMQKRQQFPPYPEREKEGRSHWTSSCKTRVGENSSPSNQWRHTLSTVHSFHLMLLLLADRPCPFVRSLVWQVPTSKKSSDRRQTTQFPRSSPLPRRVCVTTLPHIVDRRNVVGVSHGARRGKWWCNGSWVVLCWHLPAPLVATIQNGDQEVQQQQQQEEVSGSSLSLSSIFVSRSNFRPLSSSSSSSLCR